MHKRRASFIVIGVLLALVGVAGASHAAVPRLISYQGRLTNAGGTPLPDSTYPVVFRLYNASTGGAALWTQTSSVSTVDGLFNAVLGSAPAIPDSVFNYPNVVPYLGITVGSDPELTPRSRLYSSPYAFRTNSIDGALGGIIYGSIELSSSTATDGFLERDGAPYLHSYGTENLFAGAAAGNWTLTGKGNTGVGFQALKSNTTGSSNSAFGSSALANVTTGYENTAMGYRALYSNAGGDGNVALGFKALFSSTNNGWNVAVGDSAMYANNGGGSNVGVGYCALTTNTTGAFNTAVGDLAMRANTTGIQNVAVGSDALLRNTTGQLNTAIGCKALDSNITGNGNTAIGVAACILTNGGLQNTAIGNFALQQNVSGSYNTCLGSNADVSVGNLSNATAIGNGATVNASNKIRLGNSSITVIEGQVAYTFTSDKNQKENFRPVDGHDVLAKIRHMSLTSWNYKGQDPTQFRHYGPVAQEFYQAFGHDEVGSSGTETTINSGDQAGILMIAVQTLVKNHDQMRAENLELKAALAALQAEVAALKTARAIK